MAPFLSLIEKSLHAINNAAVQRSGAARFNVGEKKTLDKQHLAALLLLSANPSVSEYKCFITTHSELRRPPAGSCASDKLLQTFFAVIYLFIYLFIYYFFIYFSKRNIAVSLAEDVKTVEVTEERCDTVSLLK